MVSQPSPKSPFHQLQSNAALTVSAIEGNGTSFWIDIGLSKKFFQRNVKRIQLQGPSYLRDAMVNLAICHCIVGHGCSRHTAELPLAQRLGNHTWATVALWTFAIAGKAYWSGDWARLRAGEGWISAGAMHTGAYPHFPEQTCPQTFFTLKPAK